MWNALTQEASGDLRSLSPSILAPTQAQKRENGILVLSDRKSSYFGYNTDT